MTITSLLGSPMIVTLRSLAYPAPNPERRSEALDAAQHLRALIVEPHADWLGELRRGPERRMVSGRL